MVIEGEPSHRINVTQGLLNLTQGLNNFLTPKSSPASQTPPKPVRSSSASETIHGGGSVSPQTEQQASYKIPKKRETFSKEKRILKSQHSSASLSPSPNPSSSLSMSPTRLMPRCEYSPGSKNSERERAWPRRKGSIPDLYLKAMTTVQEYQMDSPTIPGRPPILPSSRPPPESNGPRTPALSETGSLTPRAMTGIPVMTRLEERADLKREDSQEENPERRKSSSRNLPHLLILTNDQSLLPAMAYRKSDLSGNDGPPPQVPPKSPRTMNKAFSQSVRALPSSVNSSTSTLHTTSTSITPADTPEDVVNCMPWSAPIRSDSQDAYHGGFSDTVDMVSPPPRSARELCTSSSRQFRAVPSSIDETPLKKPRAPMMRPSTPITKATSPKTKPVSPTAKPETPTKKPSTPIAKAGSRNTRQASPTTKPNPPRMKTATRTAKPESPKPKVATPVQKTGSPIKRPSPSTSKFSTALRSEEIPEPGASGHDRCGSETSVMNRGRPMRRGEASLQRKQPIMADNESDNDDGCDDLPRGVCSAKALSSIPIDELRSLRRRAKGSAKTFEILRECEVSNLSKELLLLDERCEYLRRTYVSLREGRRGLQRRIVEYLNSPRTATFSTDNIVKQEDALAELDLSIDEWTVKLERAQNCRNAIRQKLLEHSAAILTLKIPGISRAQVSDETQTPPRSPTKVDRSFSVERRDVESIRVYADSGVTSLLASIERELGKMEEQGVFELPS